jgi:hypothetical protein
MKPFSKLNLAATVVFCELWERLKYKAEYYDCHHMIIDNHPLPPLILKAENVCVQTPFGRAWTYTLAQTLVLDGKRLDAPEMTLLFIDKRNHPTDYELITILPVTCQADLLSVSEKSLIIENGSVIRCIEDLHDKLTSFANEWLSNINQQGFLKTEWVEAIQNWSNMP